MNAPRAIALCQCFTGALEFQAGNWALAESALQESVKLYRELGAASGEALAWQRLGVLQTARGELDIAMESLSEGMLAAERATMRAHCQTRLYASMTRNRLLAGDVEAAVRYLDLGLSMGRRHGTCSSCDALLLPVGVSVRITQRDFEGAQTFLQELRAAAHEYGSRTWVAMARQSSGEFRAACGELDAAVSSYTSAYEAFEAAGYDYEAARSLEAVADLKRRRDAPGDSEDAQAAAQAAREIFARLAAE